MKPGFEPRPTSMVGRAAPRLDPYASSSIAKSVTDVAREIESALVEMAPELDPGERRLMAADLAREYSMERQSAVRDMARRPSPAPPEQGREWKWDGNKYEYTDTPEYKAKEEAMRASRMSAESQQALRVERVRQQQMRNNVAMAQASESTRPGAAGAFGQMVKQYRASKDRVKPGMAQPMQPHGQGAPYGGRSQQEMYWQLVESGEDPAVASGKVARAFRNEPR